MPSDLPVPADGRTGLWARIVRWWRRQHSTPTIQFARADDVVDLRHRVLRSGRPRSHAVWSGDDDPETRHWTVQWAGEVVGVATVLARDEPTRPTHRWQLRGMALAPDVRGKGFGKALLQRVTADVDAPMWCNARESAKGFYEANGWRSEDEPFEIPRIGVHHRMLYQ